MLGFVTLWEFDDSFSIVFVFLFDWESSVSKSMYFGDIDYGVDFGLKCWRYNSLMFINNEVDRSECDNKGVYFVLQLGSSCQLCVYSNALMLC